MGTASIDTFKGTGSRENFSQELRAGDFQATGAAATPSTTNSCDASRGERVYLGQAGAEIRFDEGDIARVDGAVRVHIRLKVGLINQLTETRLRQRDVAGVCRSIRVHVARKHTHRNRAMADIVHAE